MKTSLRLYSILMVGILFLFTNACSKKTSQIGMSSLKEATWSEIRAVDNSRPIARHEAAFVQVGASCYLLGGRRIQPVSIYNTKTQKWTEGAPPPIELHHFQPVIYKNEIYILGALTGKYPGETPVPDIYIYSPQNDTWRKGDMIPENRRRGGAGAVLEGDKIYLVCGIKDGHRGDHKKWLDSYDLTTGIWTVLPDAPRARDHFQAVVVDEKIYAVAGRTTIAADNPFKNTIAEVDVYDLETKSWTTLAEPLPTLRAGNMAMALQKDILVAGGESFSQEKAHSEMEVLATETGRWSTLPPMPVGRHGTGLVVLNGSICTASGCGNRGGKPELLDFWKLSVK